MDQLSKLVDSSAIVTYDAFLSARAAPQGLDMKSRRERALVRLACCCRVFDSTAADMVVSEFSKMENQDQV